MYVIVHNEEDGCNGVRGPYPDKHTALAAAKAWMKEYDLTDEAVDPHLQNSDTACGYFDNSCGTSFEVVEMFPTIHKLPPNPLKNIIVRSEHGNIVAEHMADHLYSALATCTNAHYAERIHTRLNALE